MSLKALQEFTRISKYAKYLPEEKRRETWKEQVDRVMDMHKTKYNGALEEMQEEFDFAHKMLQKKRILGSQRALQFGGKPILDKNARLYNCSAVYIDHDKVFQEIMYLLLCGCGVGFSVQQHHIEKISKIRIINEDFEPKKFTIPDSIEGWADAMSELMNAYWGGYPIEFNYSEIRPKGAPISSGSKAPGPDGLRDSMEKIQAMLDTILSERGDTQLKSIELYDILMHISNAVLSGGVRRSACICLFSHDDNDMLTAKTGDWFFKHPHRARSNNSAVLVRNETKKETFSNMIDSVRQYGEPAFVFVDDKDTLVNPCAEIGLYSYDDEGKSGVSFCNLCEINMKTVKTESDFYDACKAAAILGTLQAGYTDFDYLGETTKKIVEREALLGISMTGMMDNPEIAFNQDIQKQGAKIIKATNDKLSKIININPAARLTCIKPSGTSSCILGTASGVHPHHSRRYFRRVQANKTEAPLQHFIKTNPNAVDQSIWTTTDSVVTFLCEIPAGAKMKNDLSAIEMLEHVKLTQSNWVKTGKVKSRCVKEYLSHNVSNTIVVKDDEWTDVMNFIWKNRQHYTGISLLPASGDKDLPQTPFSSVPLPSEMMREYGDAAFFSSGLVERALMYFDDNLWVACDYILEILTVEDETDEQKEVKAKAQRFADKYMDGDLKRVTYLMKDTYNIKLWKDLEREYKEVDWSTMVEEENTIDVKSSIACAGGACSLGDMGIAMQEKKDKDAIQK